MFVCALVLASTTPGQTHVSGLQPIKITDRFNLGGRTIVVPAPEDFTNGLGRFERFTTLITATEGPDLDILAAHVPNLIVEDLSKAATPIDLYTKVSVAKKARSMDITPESFAVIVTAVEKNFTNYVDPNSPIMKRSIASANTKMKERTGEDVGLKLREPTNLGFFDKRPGVLSTMAIMNVEANGRSQAVLTSVSFLLVNKRCIYVAVFKGLTGDEDVKTVQDLTKKWTTAIIAANR
jgi:hypothetical protein